MKNVDPDFRHMALFDLQNHLQATTAALEQSDLQIFAQYLVKCFTDQERSSDVVNMAVRVCGVLCSRLSDHLQTFVLTQLAQQVFNEKIETSSNAFGTVRMSTAEISLVRENCLMAIKLTIDQLSGGSSRGVRGGFVAAAAAASTSATSAKPGLAAIVAAQKILVDKLAAPSIAGIEERIRSDAYDLLVDMVAFGGLTPSNSDETLLDNCVRELQLDTASRKKAANCLAALCPRVSDKGFLKVMDCLEQGLKPSNGAAIGKYIQTCSVIAKSSAASRFGNKVASFTATLLQEVKRLDALPDDRRDTPEADETRELILGAIESFVANCGRHMPVEETLTATLQLLTWNPNQIDMGEENGDEDGFQFEDDDDYNFQIEEGDGDNSWRVRKAAAKTMAELLRRLNTPSMLSTVLSSTALHKAIADKVEQVKQESLALLCTALQSASTVSGGSAILSSEAPRFFTEILQMLKVDSRVRASELSTLRDLLIRVGVEVSAPLLDATVAALLTPTKSPLERTTSDSIPVLREVLLLAQRIPHHQAAHTNAVSQILQELTTVLKASTHYKMVLLTMESLRVAVPLLSDATVTSIGVVTDVYVAALGKLEPTVDGDLRKMGLDVCSAILVARSDQIAEDLRIRGKKTFVEMLRNEATQARAAEAFTASSSAGLPVEIIKEASLKFSELLRKSDQSTREAAVKGLISLFSQPDLAKSIDANVVKSIVNDLAGADLVKLLDERDLGFAAHALRLAAVLPTSVALTLRDAVFPRLLDLLVAPQVPTSLIDAAAVFAASIASCLTDLKGLSEKARSSPHHSAVLAGLVSGLDKTNQAKFINDYSTGAGGLLVLGSIGRYVALPPASLKKLVEGLLSKDDATQQAAALGAGRTLAFLPSGAALLPLLCESAPSLKGRDALPVLRALREAITLSHPLDAAVHLMAQERNRNVLLTLLLKTCSQEDAELSDTLADLVGRLFSMDARLVATAVQQAEAAPYSRAVILSGCRYLITKDSSSVSSSLQDSLEAPLKLLRNVSRTSTLPERKGFVQLLHALLQRRPLVIPLLHRAPLLTALTAELEIDMTLVMEVDLGPFKHRVDSGLELRKLAFDATASLLGSAPTAFYENWDASPVLSNLGQQLCRTLVNKDEDGDVLCTARLQLAKAVQRFPTTVQEEWVVPSVVDKLTAALGLPFKEGQDQERYQQGLVAVIRCAERLAVWKSQNAAIAALLKVARGSTAYARAKSEMQQEADELA